jgi:hypothetical protein
MRDRWCEHVIATRGGVNILCGKAAEHEIEADGTPLCPEHARLQAEYGEAVVPFSPAAE